MEGLLEVALPKKHRLRHRRDFSRVYRAGLKCKSHHLTLRALSLLDKRSYPSRLPVLQSQGLLLAQKPDSPPTRVGISISNKVSKRATVRNRMKRQIKSALSQLLPTITFGWLIVITVHPKAIECDYWQFLRELEEMLERLR